MSLARVGRLFGPYRVRLGALLALIFLSAGLGVISPAASVALIAVLDFASKVGFGLMVTFDHAKLVSRDLAEHGTVPKVRLAA